MAITYVAGLPVNDGTPAPTDQGLVVKVAGSGATGADASETQGTAADGAAAVGNPVQIGGVDGSGNVQAIAVNTDGEILVNLETADIEIGAVEIKNAADDTRAKVLAASTAAAAGDTAIVVALHPSSPLGAGTNAIGKLAANSGVDIGDVDVTSAVISDTTIDDYETVAASQTAQVLGATGATGDFLMGVLVVPATTSPGNVIILDNATSITVFTGGTSSVGSLVPFLVPLGIKSVSGAWKITTGANVSCIGIGKFT